MSRCCQVDRVLIDIIVHYLGKYLYLPGLSDICAACSEHNEPVHTVHCRLELPAVRSSHQPRRDTASLAGLIVTFFSVMETFYQADNLP